MATFFPCRARCPHDGQKEGSHRYRQTGGLKPFPRTGCALYADVDAIGGRGRASSRNGCRRGLAAHRFSRPRKWAVSTSVARSNYPAADRFCSVVTPVRSGVASVSAAVRSPSGKVVAAVSVSGPLERMTRQPSRMHAPAVMAAADRLSESLRLKPGSHDLVVTGPDRSTPTIRRM